MGFKMLAHLPLGASSASMVTGEVRCVRLFGTVTSLSLVICRAQTLVLKVCFLLEMPPRASIMSRDRWVLIVNL